MIQVIEMTDEEKMAMYMKCTKKELSAMLMSANNVIEDHIKKKVVVMPPKCAIFTPNHASTGMECALCGDPSWMHIGR